MYRLYYLVILLILLFARNVSCNLPTIRQTQNGPVEGIKLVSSLRQSYYAFKGIPFAEPPITGTDPYTKQKVDRRFKVQFYRKVIHLLGMRNYKYYFALRHPNHSSVVGLSQ